MVRGHSMTINVIYVNSRDNIENQTAKVKNSIFHLS